MPGVSDLTRVKKQQEVILSLMNNIDNFESLKYIFQICKCS